ncbi:MAG: cytochrome c biogenesis protein ResB, partial [Thermoguttaceae bacterium]
MLVSFTHAVLKLVGSLLLTVAILVALIAILLWGTVVEKNYGATAAKFGIYGSWWFDTLGFVLGFNSAVALIRRLPWKRQQMGFVIPHLGLIVLLVGCYLSRVYGVEATLMVIEGESSDFAYKSSNQHVELDGQQLFSLRVIAADAHGKPDEPIMVRFTSGPFNWDDYHNGTLGTVPWSLAHRDRGILYDRDGIRLEVLDYLSNSEIVKLPSLAVRAIPSGPNNEPAEQPKLLRFSVGEDGGPNSDQPFGAGSEQALPSGHRILFWMTGSPEETSAFRQSKFEGALGKKGRVVVYADGKSYDWSLDDWTPGTRRPLGDSGLAAELVGINVGQVNTSGDPQLDVQVRLDIHHGSASHPLVLSAEFPDVLSRQDYGDKVFGTYWPGQPDKRAEYPEAK